MRTKVLAMIICCHPGPTTAVTAIATILGFGLGYPPARLILLAGVFLTGQLSIGWSNDWLDAQRDAAANRLDKPAATGAIDARVLRAAALIALVGTIVLSLPLGVWAAIANVVAVAMGWVYNLGLKNTPWSPVPYLVCFALTPAVVTLGQVEPQGAAVWAIVAGGLLGGGAHFANVLPDLDSDRLTGIRGFPHRLGRRGSGVTAFVLLVASAVAITVGASGTNPVPIWIGLGCSVILSVIGVVLVLGRIPATRLLMRLIMLSALIDAIMLAISGTALAG
ncbi:MAG: UbiA family prenyltransferase [Microbacteriaceae bacterium]